MTDETKKVSRKALLVLNGELCELPDFSEYDGIFCSDGGFQYLPPDVVTAVIGDNDSLSDALLQEDVTFVTRPDQNYTDFDKSLMYIYEAGYSHVDVYCVGGGDQDHFLGNLNTAYRFKTLFKLRLFDSQNQILLCDTNTVDTTVWGKPGDLISLYPYPTANVTTTGLNYELKQTRLDIRALISVRNTFKNDHAKIEVHEGCVFVFQTR